VPAEATVEKNEYEAVLFVPHWLPVAEYRFLTVSASLAMVDRKGSRWTIPAARVPAVLEVLRERLGLVTREETSR
jgi:hypothetical protein